MSKLSPAQNLSAVTVAPVQEPGEDAIREYAFHLYQQGGGMPGHDIDDWLEATACLKASIPSCSSRSRLRLHVNGPATTGHLVSSPAMAKREMATLRRERESLKAEAMPADFDMRTSITS